MTTTSHSPALWSLGFAALALSGFSLWSSLSDSKNTTETDRIQEAGDTNIAESLTKIEEGQGLMLASLESLKLRVQSLENGQEARVRLSEATGDRGGSSAELASDEKIGKAVESDARMDEKEFATLLQKMFRSGAAGAASADEQELFWKLARTTTMIDDHIKELRAAVRANPGSPEKRLALADAYVAKLLTVPDGPERGLFAVKAESQWKNILKKDPSHWQSQVSLGFSHSQYPDFLNKTGEAILDFEKALKIQERLPQDNRYSVTYFQLALLYRKQGKIEKAVTTLREGNRRYPKNRDIRKLLDELQRS